jgi:thiol-disulfide isomerase/thioredoxin
MKNVIIGLATVPALAAAAVAALSAAGTGARPGLADEGSIPDLGGAIGWLNSGPLTGKSLRGKVVLVNFWTYTCINSLRPLPYVKAWADKYKDAGLVVIGVHTPEFSVEKERANVERAVRDLKVGYPVALDSNYRIWKAFNNEYWPALYLVDARGRIRHHYFGEGQYVEAERVLQELLKEKGATGLDESTVRVSGDGVEAAPSGAVQSPETYVGYRRGERFASPVPVARDVVKTYRVPDRLALNEWGLVGSWNIGAESALLETADGQIVFRFHSRDLHLVLAPGNDGRPARFKVRLDGTAPANAHGSDSTPDGNGEVREPRLYQLIRQGTRVDERTFEIEFLDPGVRAFVFTFG